MDDHRHLPSPPDRLNEIGILTRREIEARLLAPLIDALCVEFGNERVLDILRQTIVRIAHEQGAQLAISIGGDSLKHFADALQVWAKDDALQMDVLEKHRERLSFNVTRCRYAEMYRALGIPELGAVLSCNRDYALIEGFNPEITLRRTQTIMEAAPFCDFRYALRDG